ncbi:MAG: hypothetical protein DI585_05725 [Pseudomonas fluorescens]|nr:MAG: hypothetical protein DI585_05725 [Pseudomonas fluorescens]
MPFVRYDEKLKARLDLDQVNLRKAATELLNEIENHLEDAPAEAAKYKPLQQYAQQALDGQIQSPRNWSIDPLQAEFANGDLPEDIEDAYGSFAFYAHGLTIDPSPKVTMKNGTAYIEVDA